MQMLDPWEMDGTEEDPGAHTAESCRKDPLDVAFQGSGVSSGGSWMYPGSQRTPMGKSLYKPYITWVFMGFLIPKTP